VTYGNPDRGTMSLIRGNALAIPLQDETVDLIVTSPPYFALRSYRDGGQHLDGQIGAEATPQGFLDALWAATAEMARVLKPSGSIFVNLGDKYAGSGGHNNAGLSTAGSTLQGTRQQVRGGNEAVLASRRQAPDRYNQARDFDSADYPVRDKSLMLLPERYRIGCVDRLGLIAREVLVWEKPNGMPESVADRCRRSHEDWVHLTKECRYYAAIEAIKEASRAPGSVWKIATQGLRIPDSLGIDHFAAFPMEWPRRLILGWSPTAICTKCGEGRRPVKEGSVCACTPRTSNRGKRGDWKAQREVVVEQRADDWSASGLVVPRRPGGFGTKVPAPEKPLYEYDLANWTPAPTKPAVVLDPFSGAGTTVGVAKALGRVGVGVDLSADYLRLASWRIHESGHFKKLAAEPTLWDVAQTG
jgi:SAM-dependent methyltransferase